MKVYAKLGGTTLETFTVDSNGAISGTLYASDLNTGANRIEFKFYDTTEYSGDTQEVIINKGITYTKFGKRVYNPILSYADGDKTDITVQLLDNNDEPVQQSGVTISLLDGSTELAHGNTDANGTTSVGNAVTLDNSVPPLIA